MRILYRTTAAGPDGCFRPGETRDVPDELGEALIAGGYARLVERVAPVPPDQPLETATGENPETPENRRQATMVSIGGGWFELPSGTRVQGRLAAEAKLLEELGE